MPESEPGPEPAALSEHIQRRRTLIEAWQERLTNQGVILTDTSLPLNIYDLAELARERLHADTKPEERGYMGVNKKFVLAKLIAQGATTPWISLVEEEFEGDSLEQADGWLVGLHLTRDNDTYHTVTYKIQDFLLREMDLDIEVLSDPEWDPFRRCAYWMQLYHHPGPSLGTLFDCREGVRSALAKTELSGRVRQNLVTHLFDSEEEVQGETT